MKITRLLYLIALLAIGVSCSKDDDDPQPASDLENASLSFSKNTDPVQVPQGLLESEDPNAQQAAAWVEMANGLSAQLALFTPPANATKSTELITPVNGRTSASSGIVYIWSDPNYGSVAYQVRDGGDKYIFELFYKGQGDSGWYRYLYAQELKDKSAGYMVLYDAWGFMDDTRKAEMMRWSWTRQGDNFTFEITEPEFDIRYTITINTKTKAGSIIEYEGNVKLYEMTWDAQGNGTWKQYQDGQVVEQGSWS